MGKDNRSPRPGDLIEIDRPAYQHWALYMGDGYVIHVTGDGTSSFWSSTSSVFGPRAMVKKELLKKVAGKHRWCVNNKYDLFFTPRPVEEIILRAEEWIGMEVSYDVLAKNCEHFVTWLRYKVRVSLQAITGVVATGGVLAAIAAPAALAGPAVAVGGIVGGVTMAAVRALRKAISR